MEVTQKFMYYQGDGYPSSGAAVFSPSDDYVALPHWFNYTAIDVEIISKTEVRQHFHDATESTSVQRFKLDGSHLEITWTIGPLNAKPYICPEVVSRFETSLKTSGKMYTDSNGREMILRETNSRPFEFKQENGISGNYYPVTTAAFIRDEEQDMQFTVLVDRAEGGTALVEDGIFEMMLHRRTCQHDDTGVKEALDETDRAGNGLVVRGKHWISLERVATAARVWRPKLDQMYQPLRPVFGTSTAPARSADNKFQSASIIKALPANMQVISLERHQCEGSTFWQNGNCKVLLRLAHQYGPDEDAEYSKATTVDMASLLNQEALPWKVVSGIETGLTGTENRTQMLNYRHSFDWKVEGEESSHEQVADEQPWTWPQTVTFYPLQVRTFVLTTTSN